VYLPAGGAVDVDVSDGRYAVTWINAQEPSDWWRMEPADDGQGLSAPEDGDDWLLYLQKL
jgi:hypothetical protein